jgi:HPt (histidine-containing phosphotransfer) domain-containing protein
VNDPLDGETIAQLRELMGEDFAALVRAFLADSAARMKDVETAFTALDHERLRRAAHSLKGMCLNMGARKLAAVLTELEVAARERRDAATVALLWQSVANEYPLVRSAAATLAPS